MRVRSILILLTGAASIALVVGLEEDSQSLAPTARTGSDIPGAGLIGRPLATSAPADTEAKPAATAPHPAAQHAPDRKPECTVEGRVVESGSGRPLEGIAIYVGTGPRDLRNPEPGEPIAWTDADGRFTTWTDPEGFVHLRPDDRWLAPGDVWLLPERDLLIELVPARVLEGRVIGIDGAPADTRIGVRWTETPKTPETWVAGCDQMGVYTGHPSGWAETNDRGRFRVRVPAAATDIMAVALPSQGPPVGPGDALVARDRLRLPSKRTELLLDFRGGATITGEVVNDAGEPIAATLDVDVAHHMQIMAPVIGVSPTSFEVRGLNAGYTYRIGAYPKDDAYAYGEPVVVEAPATRVRIVCRKAQTLSGRVLGGPFQDTFAEFQIRRSPEHPWHMQSRVVVQKDGQFWFGRVAGPYNRIVIRKQDGSVHAIADDVTLPSKGLTLSPTTP